MPTSGRRRGGAGGQRASGCCGSSRGRCFSRASRTGWCRWGWRRRTCSGGRCRWRGGWPAAGGWRRERAAIKAGFERGGQRKVTNQALSGLVNQAVKDADAFDQAAAKVVEDEKVLSDDQKAESDAAFTAAGSLKTAITALT